jgi:hypothetical protein
MLFGRRKSQVETRLKTEASTSELVNDLMFSEGILHRIVASRK